MKDPRRLLDEGSTGFESRLLRAGRADAPAPHDRKRIAAALGVGGLFAATTVAAGASATGKSWLGLATVGAARVAVGVTAGVLAIYGGVQVLVPKTDPPSERAPTAKRPAPPLQPTEGVFTPSAPAPLPAETSEPVVRRPPPAVPADTLSEELALLDQARHALAKRDHAGALARLDEHTRRFPRRRLSSEATVLRIETLVKSGDTARATTLGKDFLARQPNGPYAKRVSSLIGDTNVTPTSGQ
jgi:hypothetical protein